MSRFASITQIREMPGLRMATLRGVPSPWTEAAKGIFRIKLLDCQYGAQGEGDPENAILDWMGNSSIPVVAYDQETPRTGWAEILIMSERLAPDPSLVPADPVQRSDMFGLAHEICGEMGLGWAYRLLMIQGSISHGADAPQFPAPVANMLAQKYGLNPVHVQEAKPRVRSILGMLSDRIAGRDYFVGEKLSAADIYWATFANLFTPLPDGEMHARSMIREAYTCRDDEILAAISDELGAHQRRIYDDYLELPVPL